MTVGPRTDGRCHATFSQPLSKVPARGPLRAMRVIGWLRLATARRACLLAYFLIAAMKIMHVDFQFTRNYSETRSQTVREESVGAPREKHDEEDGDEDEEKRRKE